MIGVRNERFIFKVLKTVSGCLTSCKEIQGASTPSLRAFARTDACGEGPGDWVPQVHRVNHLLLQAPRVNHLL
jgi:hypothetical protein